MTYTIIVIGILLVLSVVLIEKTQYDKSEYHRQTQNSFWYVCGNKGKNGEYSLVSCLEHLNGYKQYLINCYLPKPDGTTSEIDVILLHESGVYVLEAKNYSGWIFGSENQKYWTETFSDRHGGSKKYRFYNPIWQNKAHVKVLKQFLGDNSISVYSGIIFSDECELKELHITSGKHCVVNCRNLLPALQRNCERMGQQLSTERIDALYNKLFPFTQVSDKLKAQHTMQVQQAKYDNRYNKY